jgi:putative SOS response-associated peptidase YedK
MINARAKTLTDRPAFHDLLGNVRRRCLIPADGFYEWTSDGRPLRFTLADEDPYAFAGLGQRGTTRRSRGWRPARSSPARRPNWSRRCMTGCR